MPIMLSAAVLWIVVVAGVAVRLGSARCPSTSEQPPSFVGVYTCSTEAFFYRHKGTGQIISNSIHINACLSCVTKDSCTRIRLQDIDREDDGEDVTCTYLPMTILSQTEEYKTSSYFTRSSIKAPGYGDGGKERGMQLVLCILPQMRCD